MKNNLTVLLGATESQEKYAYLAAQRLHETGHAFVPVGIHPGTVFGHEILNLRQRPAIPEVDTVTLYINPTNQREWYDYILSLKPKRIIFNPGTENPELIQLAAENQIQSEQACTLVLLGTGQYD